MPSFGNVHGYTTKSQSRTNPTHNVADLIIKQNKANQNQNQNQTTKLSIIRNENVIEYQSKRQRAQIE